MRWIVARFALQGGEGNLVNWGRMGSYAGPNLEDGVWDERGFVLF